MAHPGAYRGSKRQKELKRLEKQEAKRQKRLEKPDLPSEVEELQPLDGPVHHLLPGEFEEPEAEETATTTGSEEPESGRE